MRTMWVGVAGFFGAIARYALGGAIARFRGGAFPLETLVINISGCFALGFLFALLTERFLANPTLRTALTIGFVGAYTTMAALAFETMRLAEDGAAGIAMLSLLANVVGSVAAMYGGTWLGRAL